MPDRRPPGRPPKRASARRGARVNLMVSDAEARALASDATRWTDGNVSELLRAAWREYRQRRQPASG